MIAFLATIFMIARGRVVAGVVGAAVVVAAVVGSQVEPNPGPQTVATLTLPSSDAFPLDMLHLRRGLVGGTLARAWVSVEQGGDCFVVSIEQNGSRANPVTWESELAGCTHAFADIGDADAACADVATAVASALTSAGATGVSTSTCDVLVEGATAASTGRARSTDRNDQGVFGMQRDLAFASGATTNGAMGATGGVHLNPRCTGRILAACIRADGGENVRLGIGEGPDYAVDPTAITILAEGVATAVDNNAIGCFVPTEPVAVTSPTDDTWLLFRGSGTQQLRFREHAATPVGNGDLVSGEQLIWSALSGDSSVALGASVDLGGGGGPFSLYAHVFYVDECDDSGYPGDGALDEWLGYQGTSIVGADLTDPADMVDEMVAFRYPVVPWSSSTMTAIRQGVGTRTAGDDFGIGVYLWSPADVPNFPSLAAAARAASVGAFGVSAASAFNTHTLASPVSINDALATTIAWNCGRAGGAAATSLQFVYDEDGFAGTACDLAHWTDDGRVWSDFCDEQGYSVNTEYQGRASNGSTMPIGDPTLAWPNPFAIDSTGTTDAAPLNAPRQAIRVVRTGIAVAVN